MPVTPEAWWRAWNADPLIVFGMGALAYLYGRGAQSLWRVAGRGRGVRPWQIGALGAALGAVGLALLSPLDALSEALFSAHMVQHLVLVVIAAPLLAASGPLLALMWACPRRLRRALATRMAGVHGTLRLLRIVATLPIAFAVHSAMLWVWHAPPLYEGALQNPALHATEHLALFGSAVLFWSAAWAGLPRGGSPSGASILCVFALGAQCTALGALITFSARPWYAHYAQTPSAWGLTAMDDQVLAGVIMWVPAGMVYLALALVLLGSWLSRAAADRPLRRRALDGPGRASRVGGHPSDTRDQRSS